MSAKVFYGIFTRAEKSEKNLNEVAIEAKKRLFLIMPVGGLLELMGYGMIQVRHADLRGLELMI